jgi:hypothetical protein
MNPRKILGTMALFAIAACAQGQDMQYLQTAEKQTSRIRPTLSYTLPGEVKGFSFIELYNDKSGYLSNTVLQKQIVPKTNLASMIGVSNFKNNSLALGATYTPVKNKNTMVQLGMYPLNLTKEGRTKNLNIATYAVNQQLGKGFSVSSFGQVNVATATWMYGEAALKKSLDNFVEGLTLGAGCDLRSEGKPLPKPNAQLQFTYAL